MQFQVPQFIDIEDKVIGPFTIKQFLYVAGAGALLVILFKLLNFFVFIILAIPIAALAYAFAFLKINKQPFINTVKNFFGFLKKPDFYVWKKPEPKPEKEETPKIIKKTTPKRKIKPMAKTRLQEIGWRVEIEK